MVKKSTRGVQTKAETLTVRLSPKIKYGLELLARKQRRNLSNVIEWAIDLALKQEEANSIAPVNVHESETDDFLDDSAQDISMNDVVNKVWAAKSHTRLIRLACLYPLLLTYEEEVVWDIIFRLNYFWNIFDEEGKEIYLRNLATINLYAVAQMWPHLKPVLDNQLEPSDIENIPEENPDRELISILNKIHYMLKPPTNPAPKEKDAEEMYTLPKKQPLTLPKKISVADLTNER